MIKNGGVVTDFRALHRQVFVCTLVQCKHGMVLYIVAALCKALQLNCHGRRYARIYARRYC